MSYTKLVKKWEREYKMKEKQRQAEREYLKKIDDRILITDIMENIYNIMTWEQKQKAKRDLLEWSYTAEAQKINKRLSWIVYDFIHFDYVTCINDIKRNRQTLEDVLDILEHILKLDFIQPIKDDVQRFKNYITIYP